VSTRLLSSVSGSKGGGSLRPSAYPSLLLVRLHRWFDRHPFAGDHLVAAVTAALVLGELLSGQLLSYETAVAPTAAEVVVSLVLVAPLLLAARRLRAACSAVRHD
jgi:hypothetical protein